LLKRMSLSRTAVAATSLLQEIYVITENSDTVNVYFCRPPYELKDSVSIPGMNPTDIATSYRDVCVYVLDSNNVCIWRVRRNLETTKYPLDVNPAHRLKSMSITKKGVMVEVQSGNKIVMYNPVNGETKYLSLEGVLEVGKSIEHATEIGENRLLACHNTQTFVYDLELTKVCNSMDLGGNHITLKNSKCAVIADKTSQRVWMVDIEKWEVKNVGCLMNNGRYKMEELRHVHCSMENGLLFVTRSCYLDVYSFDENDVRSYLSAEPRQQRESEAALLKSYVSHMESRQQFAEGIKATTGIAHSVEDKGKLCCVYFLFVNITAFEVFLATTNAYGNYTVKCDFFYMDSTSVFKQSTGQLPVC